MTRNRFRHHPIYLLLLFLFPLLTNSHLTHNGLPTGQTLVPTARSLLLPRLFSPFSPFQTLHDHVCADAPRTHQLTLIRPASAPSGVARTLSVSQLSALFASAASPPLGGPPTSVIVLFHGGPSCEWSRAIWPVWLNVTRRYRTLCCVAIDAANDYMLNYNLMVLGFPTIMRVRADLSAETFRGNRTEQDIVAWIGPVTGVAPLDNDVRDDEWLGTPTSLLDVTGDAPLSNTDWPLIAANIVTAGNIVWLVWKGVRMFKHNFVGKSPGEGAEVER